MLTLNNGKFFEDGKPVPLEFGNKDQLKMLAKATELAGDGVLARHTEFGEAGEGSVTIEYMCMCGTNFERQYSFLDWNALQTDKFTCAGCGIKYLLDGESFEPFILVKFENIKKKKSVKEGIGNG
jgi:hypothetical protein